MTVDNFEPEKVYMYARDTVNKLIDSLTYQSKDKDTQEYIKDSRNILVQLQNNITSQLERLEKNAEWETFTIAMYGETNAGKSTIIETLRILLGEDIKKDEQQRFRDWQVSSRISQASIDQLKHHIQNNEKQLQVFLEKWKSEKYRQENEIKELAATHQNIEKENSMGNASLIWRFLWWFLPMPVIDGVRLD